MDEFIKKLCEIEIGTLIVMAGMFWIFKSHLEKKFEKIEKDMQEIRKDMQEIRKDIQEIRTSLNRMEGAFYSKDCCMLKDDKKEKAG